jgi:pimeloyl-ACP methyl ester carboxylesterase
VTELAATPLNSLDPLGTVVAAPGDWPPSLGRARPWLVHYLGWDGLTSRQAWIVIPSGWGPHDPPAAAPLVISPHGRNNAGWSNALVYWQDLPADGPFILVCPDGLGRAHSRATDPFDQPPTNPGLFTYGYPQEIDDLARMPQIVEATLPWLRVDMEQVYVLGSSMGGQETLLLAARYPHSLAAGTGKLAGAAAFDAPCDLPTQCAYLTHQPSTANGNPAAVAALMLEEVGSKPASLTGFLQTARFYNDKRQAQMTIGQLLAELPADESLWEARSPLNFVQVLANLPFPLRMYWSTADVVVGNQATEQSGKLYTRITASNPGAHVTHEVGTWAHSAEFAPDSKLGEALTAFGLIGI